MKNSRKRYLACVSAVHQPETRALRIAGFEVVWRHQRTWETRLSGASRVDRRPCGTGVNANLRAEPSAPGAQQPVEILLAQKPESQIVWLRDEACGVP